MDGEVIGITTAGFSEGQNLNLAIPINEAKTLQNSTSPKTVEDVYNELYPTGNSKDDVILGSEGNNTLDGATTIYLDKLVGWGLRSISDKDYYKLKINTFGKINIVCGYNDESLSKGNSDIIITLYDKTGEIIEKSVFVKGDKFQYQILSANVAPNDYYISISINYYGTYYSSSYVFKVTMD